MAVRVARLMTKLVIFGGIILCSSLPIHAQKPEAKRVKKVRQVSERKALRQSTKVSEKRRKQAYKIQDRPTRKRMRKTYKKSMRRQKKK
jgi:hypothetical protein